MTVNKLNQKFIDTNTTDYFREIARKAAVQSKIAAIIGQSDAKVKLKIENFDRPREKNFAKNLVYGFENNDMSKINKMNIGELNKSDIRELLLDIIHILFTSSIHVYKTSLSDDNVLTIKALTKVSDKLFAYKITTSPNKPLANHNTKINYTQNNKAFVQDIIELFNNEILTKKTIDLLLIDKYIDVKSDINDTSNTNMTNLPVDLLLYAGIDFASMLMTNYPIYKSAIVKPTDDQGIDDITFVNDQSIEERVVLYNKIQNYIINTNVTGWASEAAKMAVDVFSRSGGPNGYGPRGVLQDFFQLNHSAALRILFLRYLTYVVFSNKEVQDLLYNFNINNANRLTFAASPNTRFTKNYVENLVNPEYPTGIKTYILNRSQFSYIADIDTMNNLVWQNYDSKISDKPVESNIPTNPSPRTSVPTVIDPSIAFTNVFNQNPESLNKALDNAKEIQIKAGEISVQVAEQNRLASEAQAKEASKSLIAAIETGERNLQALLDKTSATQIELSKQQAEVERKRAEEETKQTEIRAQNEIKRAEMQNASIAELTQINADANNKTARANAMAVDAAASRAAEAAIGGITSVLGPNGLPGVLGTVDNMLNSTIAQNARLLYEQEQTKQLSDAINAQQNQAQLGYITQMQAQARQDALQRQLDDSQKIQDLIRKVKELQTNEPDYKDKPYSEILTKLATDVIVKDTQSCEIQVNANQSFDFSGVNTYAGSIVMKQKVSVSASCYQDPEKLLAIQEKIKDQIAQFTTAINQTVLTDSKQKITGKVTKDVNNKYTAETFQKMISIANGDQKVTISAIDSILEGLVLDQSVDIYTQVVQQSVKNLPITQSLSALDEKIASSAINEDKIGTTLSSSSENEEDSTLLYIIGIIILFIIGGIGFYFLWNKTHRNNK